MSQETLYPVYIYHDGMELPKEGTYFVVAGNGQWMHKDTGIVRCFVPVDRISMLNDINAETEVESKLPKVPARIVWRIKQFFAKVVDKYRSEAEVTLYYNKEAKDFKVHIPEQTVSHAGVKYKRAGLTHLEGMENYLRVGTIHSHCDFNAFHSGTDIDDEKDFDGLHVTFGHNDRDIFTVSASIVVNGQRVKVEPLTVMNGLVDKGDGMYCLQDSDYDPEYHTWADGLDDWMSQVNGHATFHSSTDSGFVSGCKAAWAGDMKACQLKEVMGDGPFTVIDCLDGKIAIKTKIGFARLSSKLFRRV